MAPDADETIQALRMVCDEQSEKIASLRAALQKWVEYDDLGETDFEGIDPMFLYDEAIVATRDALSK